MRFPAIRRHCCGFFVAGSAIWGWAQPGFADSVTFSGRITQSTQNGTGPAVNNPTLNNILDNDAYSVTLLNFARPVTGLGTFALNPATLALADATSAAIEASFANVSFCSAGSGLACLTVSADTDGVSDDISLVLCLTTGMFGCIASNQLAADFKIPAASLHSTNAAASPIPSLTPLDLLEDDGTTDIQGSVTSYSYTGTSPIPEPSLLAPLVLLLAPLVWMSARRVRHPTTPC